MRGCKPDTKLYVCDSREAIAIREVIGFNYLVQDFSREHELHWYELLFLLTANEIEKTFGRFVRSEVSHSGVYFPKAYTTFHNMAISRGYIQPIKPFGFALTESGKQLAAFFWEQLADSRLYYKQLSEVTNADYIKLARAGAMDWLKRERINKGSKRPKNTDITDISIGEDSEFSG